MDLCHETVSNEFLSLHLKNTILETANHLNKPIPQINCAKRYQLISKPLNLWNIFQRRNKILKLNKTAHVISTELTSQLPINFARTHTHTHTNTHTHTHTHTENWYHNKDSNRAFRLIYYGIPLLPQSKNLHAEQKPFEKKYAPQSIFTTERAF